MIASEITKSLKSLYFSLRISSEIQDIHRLRYGIKLESGAQCPELKLNKIAKATNETLHNIKVYASGAQNILHITS